MNQNWEQLIKAIVPLSFLAIWALTSLFNRESKGFPAKGPSSPPSGGGGPRVVDPTLRWANQTSSQGPGVRRVPIGDDDILIIQNDPTRPMRPASPRPGQVSAPRRGAKAKNFPAPARKIEAPAQRARLAGVSQVVNQQIGKQIELAPLTDVPPTTSTHTLTEAIGVTGSRLTAGPTAQSIAPLLANPARLREAFILNEILRPPVSLRVRPPGRSRA